jgi:hypothetical protein
MKKLELNQGKHNDWAGSSIAEQICPRCGNGKIRKSSMRKGGGVINILFRDPYRCQLCSYRFWMLNPLRLLILAGILLVLIPISGALWMSANEQPLPQFLSTDSPEEIKRLADKGDVNAELQMGLYHSSLTWGSRDDKLAAQWFEKAARHGQVDAQYHYGQALRDGQGVVQDYRTAFYWLEKAARQGHAQAQFALGEMYHAGTGTKSDKERAYLWFNLAAAQSVGKAATNRDLVSRLLTTERIDAMQQEASRINRGLHPK